MIGRPSRDPVLPHAIRVRGARTHNLKNIDLDIPHNRLVVITGPSGSGKSSLAFDTLFSEGQRQYIESLSVHARQFIHQMQRPDVDLIDGLPPTLSIDQHRGSHNPRSTLATLTEIHDYLRLLFARVGLPHCPGCGQPICRQTPEEIVELLSGMPSGTKAMILAPLVRGRCGRHADILAALRKAGFVRTRIDGVTYPLDEVPELAAGKRHSIEAVVDRVIIREGGESRWSDSIRLAIRHGKGLVVITSLDPGQAGDRTRGGSATGGGHWHDRLFSTEHGCPDCGIRIEEIEPRTFSFNSPYGACPACEGLGSRTASDAKKELATATRAPRREQLEVYRGTVCCQECGGARLHALARGCRIGEVAIQDVAAMTIDQAVAFFRTFEPEPTKKPITDPIAAEIVRRLEFLERVGAGYLTLDRPSDTLSGGELQRVRLAAGIGSGLVGVCYLLDEPSIGLHPRDNQRL
ncbi:MAG: ABC-ATPase UvrA, partial [Pirellulales bacterium]